MGVLIKNGTIYEISYDLNFAYVLNDNNDFLLTEYKVLQSQSNRGFIKCMKMLYNGKIELYYLTSGRKTLTSMLPSLDEKEFLTIVSNLLYAIIEVKNNGFLSCQNIDISFDKIFVDPSNFTVELIYLPINIRAYKNFTEFENELRMNLFKLINNVPSLSSHKMSIFYAELRNGKLTLESLAKTIKNISPGTNKGHTETRKSTLTLVALDTPSYFELLVDKDEYIIGKNASMVDGFISFNKAISRVHCKMIKVNGTYSLEDLESLNGTYLNGKRLVPHKPAVVNNEDIVRLADSDFQVRILQGGEKIK